MINEEIYPFVVFFPNRNGCVSTDAERSDSPVEAMMLRALIDCGFRQPASPATPSLGTIYQQHRIDDLRVDFAIVRFVEDYPIGIAVEVDGYNFHQRTREQVDRDNARDNKLQRLGWTVLRYSGSRVHHDAMGCALDVADTLIERVNRIQGGHIIEWVDV